MLLTGSLYGSLSFLFHKPQDDQPRGKPARYGLGPPTLIRWSRNVTTNIPSGGHPDGDTFSVEGPSSLMTRKALTSTPTQTPHQGLASHLIVYCTVCVADDKKKVLENQSSASELHIFRAAELECLVPTLPRPLLTASALSPLLQLLTRAVSLPTCLALPAANAGLSSSPAVTI